VVFALQKAVLLLGYVHYFVAYGVCTACVIGALLVASTIEVPQSLAARAASSRSLSELLLSVKIVLAGWLFYLVLLRRSKVHMWLTYRNQAPTLDNIYDFLKGARPYFEASREGVFTNIFLGLLWSTTCIAIHVFSASILNASRERRSANGCGLRISMLLPRQRPKAHGRFPCDIFAAELSGITRGCIS
jgi:hypothetical protein